MGRLLVTRSIGMDSMTSGEKGKLYE